MAELAHRHNIIDGVVHDKLYLPGLVKLRRLVDMGFFGRILSMRGEFGYWVWEGTDVPSQRPSWNYHKTDGGSMTTDMYPHWNYVIEGIIGQTRDVYSQTATHITKRVDEQGNIYNADTDDAAYAIFNVVTPSGDPVIVQMNSSWATRVFRDELLEFQIDGTHGSAVAGLFGCVCQPRGVTPPPPRPGIPTSLTLMTTCRCGRRFPTTPPLPPAASTTVSRHSGRNTSPTSRWIVGTASTCCREHAKSNLPNSDCGRPPRDDAFTSPRSWWTSDE